MVTPKGRGEIKWICHSVSMYIGQGFEEDLSLGTTILQE